VPDGYFLLGTETTALLVEGLEASLTKLVADHTTREGVTLLTHFVQGNPDHEIDRFVVDIDAQMIVMGTHGRHRLSHLLLGSVAEKVIRNARARRAGPLRQRRSERTSRLGVLRRPCSGDGG